MYLIDVRWWLSDPFLEEIPRGLLEVQAELMEIEERLKIINKKLEDRGLKHHISLTADLADDPTV